MDVQFVPDFACRRLDRQKKTIRPNEKRREPVQTMSRSRDQRLRQLRVKNADLLLGSGDTGSYGDSKHRVRISNVRPQWWRARSLL